MKHLGKLAVLGAVLAASAPFASATSLLYGNLNVYPADTPSNQGADSFSPTSISFNPTTNPNSFVASGGGYLGSIAVGDTAQMSGITYTSSPTNQLLLTVNDSQSLSFTVTGIYQWNDVVSGNNVNLAILGTGYFSDLAGDTTEYGTFNLSSSSTTCGSQTCSAATVSDVGFNFTPAANATPEPSSLLLLGTGLLGTAGILMRKRQTA